MKLENVRNQMVEVKQNADQVENKIYDYLQLVLDQLRNQYTVKSEDLRSNYLELLKKSIQITYNHDFIEDTHYETDKVDFLNQWEVYQK